MAATSPYLQNDYQSVSTFRPYQLPINDIFKGIAAQDQFWKQGAARVKAVYDNALDLQLTNAENIEIRDNYLKEAQKQLTKLSTMNLADSEVQRKGFDLFKPLFRDMGVMSDDQATRHIQKVNTEALSWRNRENGKYYSPTNHQYALFGADEFRNSTDRFAGKTYLENKKEYEPFYDPTTELNTILKNCQPDKASGEATKGFHINGYSVEAKSAMRIASCLDAGMSDKAKRQLQINGAVTYRNNPEALRDKYVPLLQGTRKGLSEQKAAIEGILANQENLGKLTQKDLQKLGLSSQAEVTPELIESLKERHLVIGNRILNMNETIGKITSGDYSPMMGGDFESIAGAIYSQDYMENVGEGFEYEWRTNTVKADPVQMMFYREKQLNARQEDNQAHDKDMQSLEFEQDLKLKQMDLMAKMMKDGNLKGSLQAGGMGMLAQIQSGGDNVFSALESGESYDQVTRRISELSNIRNGLNLSLNQQLKEYHGMEDYAPGSDEEKQWIANYTMGLEKLPANDPKRILFESHYKKLDEVNALNQLYKNTQDFVDQQTSPLETELKSKITQNNPISFTHNGQTFTVTGEDMYNAITGKPGRVQVQFGSSGSNVTVAGGQAMGAGTSFSASPDYITVDGVRIPITAGKKLYQTLRKYNIEYNDQAKKIKDTRNDMMTQELISQRETYQLPGINDKDSNFRNTLASNLGLPEAYWDKIVIGPTDGNGNVKVEVLPAKDSESDYDAEDVLERLTTYGSTDNQRIDPITNAKKATGSAVLLRGIKEMDVIDDTDLAHTITPLVRSYERRATITQSASSGFITSGNGGEYRLAVNKDYDGKTNIYSIISKDTGKPIHVSRDRDDAVRVFMSTLSRYAPKVKVQTNRQ